MYKILVHLNRIPPSYDVMLDFEKARLYHKKHGVDISFIFKNININGYSSVLNTYINKYLISGAENLLQLDQTFDANMFVFDMAEWATPPSSPFPLKPTTPNGSCMLVPPKKPFICVGTYPTDHNNGLTAIQIAHEIMHSLVQNAKLKGILIQDVMDTYMVNDLTDQPNSNFIQQWKLLEPYLNVGQYQYFSVAEVTKWKLKPELWQILDKMRKLAGTPFVITSGLRTVQENTNAGGKPNSSHLRGLAVDLACSDNIKRTLMLKGILGCEIPVFLEVAKGHLHIDIDPSIHQLNQTMVSDDD